MAKEFLVKGARCVCKYGSLTGRFTVLDHSHFYINGHKLAGSTLSLGNTFELPGFGVCRVNPIFPKPCIPAIVKWKKPYLALKNALGGNILTDQSTATCSSGCPDCISVLMTGQIPLPGVADFTKATSEQQEDIDPIGESEGLTAHNVKLEAVAGIVSASSSPTIRQVASPNEVRPKLLIQSARFAESPGDIESNMMTLQEGQVARIRVASNRTVVRGDNNTFFYKYYYKKPGSGKYELEENGGEFKIPVGQKEVEVEIAFPVRFSGTEIAVSFYKGTPFKPTSAVQNTVRYLKIACSPKIVNAYWSAQEIIPKIEYEFAFPPFIKPVTVSRYIYAPKRKEIRKNEVGFLHIHTKGLYGKEIEIELFERDVLPSDFNVGKVRIVVNDNVACVAFPMDDVLAFAGPHRSLWLEAGDLDLYCKITVPYQGGDKATPYLMPSEDDLLLKFNLPDAEPPAKSTINGSQKFVIGTVEEEGEEKSVAPDKIISPVDFPNIGDGVKIRPKHPVTGRFAYHKGVDITNYKESCDGKSVYAPLDGTVIATKNDNSKAGTGTMVKYRDIYGYIHIFMHLQYNSIEVSESDVLIEQKTVLAKIGNTGGSTGSHLHYEIRDSVGLVIDPLAYNSDLKNIANLRHGSLTDYYDKWKEYKDSDRGADLSAQRDFN